MRFSLLSYRKQRKLQEQQILQQSTQAAGKETCDAKLWYAAQTSMQAKPGKTLRVGDSYTVVDSSNSSAFVLIGDARCLLVLFACCQKWSSKAYL